jgi:sulfate transport system ATP-binding protein
VAIDANTINKSFDGRVVLHDVSVKIEDGSLTALLGPSGSGKSTLLRIIAGLEKPDAGTVSIGGRDVTDLPPRDRGIGFVFQHYAAFRHMTVFQNVAFGLKIRRRPRAEIRERVMELLRLVQIEDFADRYPSQLSGGQRQRMALARSLAIRPSVLLLDEPFGALDAQVRRELRAWLRRLHEEMHVTTVIVTHDQEEAMEISDRVVILNDGRIEQAGEPRYVYDHPASKFVMGFLGEVTSLDADQLTRPHDLEISVDPIEGGSEAIIERIVHLGFEVRVEVVRADGWKMQAQMTADELEHKELLAGQIVYARSRRPRTFDMGDVAADAAAAHALHHPAGSDPG